MCNRYGNRGFGMHHGQFRKFAGGDREFKIPVNIIRNENSYELMVFAPDRKKEDFNISIKGHELAIAYHVKDENAEKRNWIRHEFSKTSFERKFTIDETVDTENIRAEYNNGILQVILPVIPGSEKPAQEIRVS